LSAHNHHLEEIKVVLIKRLMSDQLPFIGVAKRVLTIADLRRIYSQPDRHGQDRRQGGGMYLAWRSLQPLRGVEDQWLSRGIINIPDSYFIGTDVIYEFFLMNKLEHYMNQKYRPVHEIRAEYPRIVAGLSALGIARLSGDASARGRSTRWVIARSSSVLPVCWKIILAFLRRQV
jgi:hypothetical protein